MKEETLMRSLVATAAQAVVAPSDLLSFGPPPSPSSTRGRILFAQRRDKGAAEFRNCTSLERRPLQCRFDKEAEVSWEE